MTLIDSSRGIYLKEVDSTNNYILTHKLLGSFVVAEIQTAGRGRASKTWISNESNNLYFSALVGLKNTPQIPLFSLLCGKAVLKTCKKFFPSLTLSLKWPNDIYLEDKKVAGILLEMQSNLEEVLLVIGIGVNFYFSSIPENIPNLGMLMNSPPPKELKTEFIKTMIFELNQVLLNLYDKESLEEDWDFIYQHSYLRNKKIQFDVHETILIGEFLGYNEYGFLMLSANQQVYVLSDTTPNFGVLDD